MNKQNPKVWGFEAVQGSDTKALIAKILASNISLAGWQRAYVNSAANTDNISDTQARIIRGIEVETMAQRA